MNKKILILSAFLACSYSLCNETKFDKLSIIKVVYDELKKEYKDSTLQEIEKHEKRLKLALSNYTYKALEDEANISNLNEVTTESNNLLQYLLSETNFDNAYSTASMLFMYNWLLITADVSKIVIAKKQQELFYQVNQKINKLVEKIFVEPLKERIEILKQRNFQA